MFAGYFAKTETAAKIATFFTGVLSLASSAPSGTPAWTLIGSDGAYLDDGSCTVVSGVVGATSNTVWQISLDLTSYAGIVSGESYTVVVTYTISSLTYFREFRFSVY